MNVSCPECRSVFRVDPAKVPSAGVDARCSVCGAVIAVSTSTTRRVTTDVVAAAQQSTFTDAEHATSPVAVQAISVSAADTGGVPAASEPELHGPELRESDAVAPMSPASEPAAPAETRTRPVNPYLNNTPELRARRLARALVSDLVAYNPQKREEGLRDGTLRQLFREEIRKSWDEYVEQVGASVAESTPHFQDALNDVLAGGRRVF